MKLRYSQFAHRIDIDEMVNELGIDFISEEGAEMRAFCPMPYNAHTNGDTTGKFSINREKRIWGCWVCGGGNFLDLAMALKDMDPEPAIKWLHQFASHEETDDEFEAHLEELLGRVEDRQPTMPYFNQRAIERFESASDHPWVRERGISQAVAETFGLRFNPRARRTNKEEVYEGPSIYLPHMWGGKLCGWQQRWLEPEEDRPRFVPKYTMTPDFPKNETLFGYHDAQDWMRHEGSQFTVVVESVPSALFLWSHSVPAVVTFGSSVAEAQLKLLRTFPRLILAPDNDEAGAKWTNALVSYLERYTTVDVLPMLEGAGSDIGDLAAQPELLSEYLQMAYNSVDTLT